MISYAARVQNSEGLIKNAMGRPISFGHYGKTVVATDLLLGNFSYYHRCNIIWMLQGNWKGLSWSHFAFHMVWPICWMLNLASQFDILCNLPEIKDYQILHPFLALDIFEWWQNLDFSPFVSYEGGKSNCWHYPEIKEGDQVYKICHFEKKIYCPTWGVDPPKIRISEEFSTSRGRCAKCKRFATLIMRECNI